MNLTALVKQLDAKSDARRMAIIEEELETLGIRYQIHHYPTGINLIADLGKPSVKVGLSCHFDRVPQSPGANDNGSAVVVCLDILRRWKSRGQDDIGLRVFFFDEEENGLLGSAAYVEDYGISGLSGLINLEMVGVGDRFALWSVHDTQTGAALQAFEAASGKRGVPVQRFDHIVTNAADHLSFRRAGMQDAFSVTCITEQDIAKAIHYYKALEFEVDQQTLHEILAEAPLFRHYHQPTDTYEKLSCDTLKMTADVVWDTILSLHHQ